MSSRRAEGQRGLRGELEGNMDLVSKSEAGDGTATEEREFLMDVHGGASLGSHALWRRDRLQRLWRQRDIGRRGKLTPRGSGHRSQPHPAELLGQLLYQRLHGVSNAQYQGQAREFLVGLPH